MDYSILINLLRTKQIVTPLEKDILDTWNELQKTPFDMDSSQRQILSNAISHPDIAVKVTTLPTTTSKPVLRDHRNGQSIYSSMSVSTLR